MFTHAPPTFMAASIPRYIRTARLPWLRLESIIGCWVIENDRDLNLVFDVVMLPEHEFRHLRAHLSVAHVTTPALARSQLMGSYILRDVKSFTPPIGENPVRAATLHFIKAFDLDINRTVYADGASVAASVSTRMQKPVTSTRVMAVPKMTAMTARTAPRSGRSPIGLLRLLPIKELPAA